MTRWSRALRAFGHAAVIAVLLAGSFGCHTVRGVGRDVESVGRSVERAPN